jgi:UMF1 family MFS transporter
MTEAKRRIWGWFFFDWASQPYNTLLLTFIFAPFVGSLMGDGTAAQTVWGYGIGAAGVVIAVLSPVLGAIADKTGRRMGFIVLFSIMYFVGAWGLWYASPEHFNVWIIMLSFGIGLVGMEFATTFTNAMLPDLGTAEEIGRISGSGWAFGYLGGLLSLILVLTLFAENAEGTTLLGIAPILGLDAGLREGTRAVGPFSAIWYAVFMIPFFLWVREPRREGGMSVLAASRRAWPDLKATLRGLPARRQLFCFLLASMFYRDALNGLYTFGGIYARGVLGWQITEIGIFGILTIITGAIFAWAGGRADSRFGPYPVIVVGIVVLTATTIGAVFLSREHVFGFATGPDSRLPDMAFYLIGALIGAAGGAMQSASRTMMLRLVDPAEVTEGFGLYALTGKATSFMAPLSIGVVTGLTGSQQLGFIPLILLFLVGFVLLLWVRPNGGTSNA